mmetsp:Transcript_8356/g.20798  ORF Transcript_8356/g.20798 Transcript_8356/m.20798 type:complete len:249 (-) Transcript_8356:121-867(-)
MHLGHGRMQAKHLRARTGERGIVVTMPEGQNGSNGDFYIDEPSPIKTAPSSQFWYFAPVSAVLTVLLLSSLYMLQVEQAQLNLRDTTINELKAQIRGLKDQLSQARHKLAAEEGEGAQLLQAAVKKAEGEVEKVRSELFEANKKVQDLTTRIATLQSDRGKLSQQLKAATTEKQRLAKQLGIANKADTEASSSSLASDITAGARGAGAAAGAAGDTGQAAAAAGQNTADSDAVAQLAMQKIEKLGRGP